MNTGCIGKNHLLSVSQYLLSSLPQCQALSSSPLKIPLFMLCAHTRRSTLISLLSRCHKLHFPPTHWDISWAPSRPLHTWRVTRCLLGPGALFLTTPQDKADATPSEETHMHLNTKNFFPYYHSFTFKRINKWAYIFFLADSIEYIKKKKLSSSCK